MATRIITKVGDIYKTKSGRLLQLVAIDFIQLNSDVVVVYEPTDNIDFNDLYLSPISFYQHTTVSAGVKQELWQKVGRAPTPDISKLVFKQYFDKETAEILHNILHTNYLFKFLTCPPRSYWTTWNPNDESWKRVSHKKGMLLQAEESGVTPPDDIIYRIKHGHSAFKSNWPT